jgi:hypothetical protein
MYSITKGYEQAFERADALRQAGFWKEAFVYSAICLETVCYRLLRSAAIKNGMEKELFEEVVGFGGFYELKKKWKFFCTNRKSLSDWFKDDKKADLWKAVVLVVDVRNDIFHGKAGISEADALKHSTACWEAIDFLVEKSKAQAWDDPFSRAKRWPKK